jgi:hypothetical protein
MAEVQEVMERTDSPTFCWWSVNKGSFSTDMFGCVFHSFSVWYNFCSAFSYETAADHSFGYTALFSIPVFIKPWAVDQRWSGSVVPCSLVENDRRFRGTYCVHLCGDQSSSFLSSLARRFSLHLWNTVTFLRSCRVYWYYIFFSASLLPVDLRVKKKNFAVHNYICPFVMFAYWMLLYSWRD